MARRGQPSEARKITEKLGDKPSRATAWYAVTRSEVAASPGSLLQILERIDTLRGDADKAASFAGVAAALPAKWSPFLTCKT